MYQLVKFFLFGEIFIDFFQCYLEDLGNFNDILKDFNEWDIILFFIFIDQKEKLNIKKIFLSKVFFVIF